MPTTLPRTKLARKRYERRSEDRWRCYNRQLWGSYDRWARIVEGSNLGLPPRELSRIVNRYDYRLAQYPQLLVTRPGFLLTVKL